MYLPLKFLEMMDSYILIPGATSKQLEDINSKNIEWTEKFMRDEKDFFFDTYAQYKDFCTGARKSVKASVADAWTSVAEKYKYDVRIVVAPDEDFLNTMLFTHLRNEWRKRKLVYRVGADLKEELTNMKMDKLVSLNCVQNVPSNYFYIDYSDSPGFAGKDNGCMVAVNVSKSVITIILTLMYDCDKVGTIIVSLGIMLNDGNDSNVLFLSAEDARESIDINVQGEPAVFREKAFKRFILNFFVYLYAANNDITVSEKTRNTYRKPKSGAEPKNKFREVEAFDVGFRYVSPKKNKVKYIDVDSEEVIHGKGSPKCTHYRSAHWHSYWVKEDDNNKKLIVKWVDGVMVNGSEAKNVTVTKI